MIREHASAGLAEPGPGSAVAAPAPELQLGRRITARVTRIPSLVRPGALVAWMVAATTVCLLTVQIDLLPVARIGEMPVRPGLLALMLTAFTAGLALWRERKSWSGWPPGTAILLGLAVWNAIVTLVTGPDAHGWGYLVLTFILVASATMIGMMPHGGLSAHRLLSLYRWSLVAMAAFGLVQFLLDNLGVPMLVQLHWPNGVPRVNGLSSEPSYYSTYMLPGLPLCHSRARGEGRWAWHGGTALIIFAIILSNSRIGMLATGLWWCYQLAATRGGLRTRIAAMTPAALAVVLGLGLQIGVVLARTPGMGISGWFSAGDAPAQVDGNAQVQFATRQMFEGTGVAGTVSESRDARLRGLRATARVAREHALTGVGVGHVRREAIKITGHPYSAVINVTLELLAGIGVIGFALLLGWLIAIVPPLWRVARAGGQSGTDVVDLAAGFGLMWFALQANQNAFRLPLWIHIGLVLALLTEAVRRQKAVGSIREVARSNAA